MEYYKQLLIMIYKHKYLKNIFIENKQVKQITKANPIYVAVQDQQFLHYTISTALKHLDIPHLISNLKHTDLEQKRKNMGHQLPTLIFGDVVLETNQLVQFICDAFNNDNELIDFQSRKATIKDLVRSWKQIFLFQRMHPHNFKELQKQGVKDKKSYQILIMQNLAKLEQYFVTKIIQRAYANYSEQAPSLQAIVFVDIITTIMEKCPSTYVDFSLRSTFKRLINIKDQLKIMIDNSMERNHKGPHQVVLQQPSAVQPEDWQKIRLNGKRFLIIFGFLSTMYGIFAKP